MYSLRQWWMFAKQINHQYNVSILRMLLENIVLYCFRGVGPRYYFEAQIWQPQLS